MSQGIGKRLLPKSCETNHFPGSVYLYTISVIFKLLLEIEYGYSRTCLCILQAGETEVT